MTVLYVGTLPPHPGGTAHVAALLLSGFAGLGVQVHAIAPRGPDTHRASAFASAHPHLRVARFEMPFFESNHQTPASAEYRVREEAEVRRLFAEAVRHSPDVVLIGRENFACPVVDLACEAGIPSVLLFQGGLTWAMLDGSVPSPRQQALRSAYGKADLRIAVAAHLRDAVRQMGLDAVHVPNPADVERFQPQPRSPRLMQRLGLAAGPVLLHASNFNAIKRAGDLVDAAPAILARHPDATLLFIGDGPQASEVRAAAARAGVTGRCRFTGWVDHDEMAEYYNLADLVVMPSQAEGMSLVYLEAMACGRVVVASDIAAARELFTDGMDGLLFPVGDASALAAVVSRALDEPARLAAIGARARITASMRSSADCVRQYLHLLEATAARAANGLGSPAV